MKKIICLLCTLILFVSSFCALPCFGKESDNISSLWKRREEYKCLMELQLTYTFPYYPNVESGLIFFYTDTALNMKFELKDPREFDSFGYSFNVMEDFETTYFIYNERLYQILTEYKNRWKDEVNVYKNWPMLWAVIHELDISKEELIKANNLCKTSPQSIRQEFPDLAERDLNCFYGSYLSDYEIDALYVQDEETALNLLCPLWSIRIDGVAYTLPRLADKIDKNGTIFFDRFSSEQLKTVDQTALKYFLKYGYGQLERPEYSRSFDAIAVKSVLDTLSAYYADSPETGDNTLILLTVTALSVLGLCALAVAVGRRKKERF